MINIPISKIYNSYIIETYNFESVKSSIRDFAILNGFDRELVNTNNHPDLFFIESEEKKIPIDVIRKSIVESAIYAPKIADKKIYVIYDSIYLEEDTQNTMLKTLEEPPSFDIFFLVTTNANKFLDTVKSRCVIIRDDEGVDYKKILTIDYIDEALVTLANIKYESSSVIMDFAEKIIESDNNLRTIIMIYRYVIRDAMLYKITLSKDKLYLREKEDDIISIANSFTLEEFGRLIDGLDKLADANKYNINKKIALFNFFEV